MSNSSRLKFYVLGDSKFFESERHVISTLGSIRNIDSELAYLYVHFYNLSLLLKINKFFNSILSHSFPSFQFFKLFQLRIIVGVCENEGIQKLLKKV